jgi:RND family efflux transporter MFP subunit
VPIAQSNIKKQGPSSVYLILRSAFILLVLGAGVTPGGWAADFDCVIQPRQVLEIRSPIEGLLDRIMVDRGQMVRKDQKIALIDISVERVLAESAKYRSEMEGATRAGQSKVQLGIRKYNRAQELSRRNFVSEQAQDEALNEKQLAEAELQEARDNRKLAEIEYRRLLAQIRLKTIISPINGVVMERILNVGELVEAGVGRKPILRLAEIDTLYVEALLPAEVYRQIRVGMVGEVSSAIAEATTQRATVTVIDRVLDASSGTFGVRLELPNKSGELLAGVRCKVNFAGVNATRAVEPARESAKPRVAKPPAPK